MRALLLVLTALTLCAPTVPALPVAGDAQRYIVGFHDWPGLAPGERYAGGDVVAVDETLRFAVVSTDQGALFEMRAQADDNVRYLEADGFLFGLFMPNDARYNDAGHYGTKKIGAETAWDRTRGSASVKVAVIDSGLRKTHEEFAGSGRVLQGYDFVNGDSDPNDDCGHGTHVAGTIGATIHNGKGIAGMAQVTILPIKGLAYSVNPLSPCSGAVSGLASALRYAADQGAHISSNSWGGGSATALNDAISYAKSKGVTMVAAAGNDGSCTNCVNSPWRENAANVIIVSSTDQNDALSSFSSQGPEVDVAAPGTSILSAYDSSDTSYSTLSGTSMAAPHVSGLAALLKTQNPSWGYAELDGRLKSTAKDLGTAGQDVKFGYGRIDAAAATASGSTPPPTNQPPTACFTHSESGLTTSASGACSSDPDGSIASWSWSWGDGSPASTGPSASHAYATAGTYTVTLTVADNAGATASTSQSVTVSTPSDPDPGSTTLSSGQTVSRTSGGAGSEQFFKIQVPAGASQLQVVLDGPACTGLLGCSADLDLYVRKGARPTDALYDCRPYQTGSDETCTHASPAADWWYVRVDVYAGSNVAYTLRATVS